MGEAYSIRIFLSGALIHTARATAFGDRSAGEAVGETVRVFTDVLAPEVRSEMKIEIEPIMRGGVDG